MIALCKDLENLAESSVKEVFEIISYLRRNPDLAVAGIFAFLSSLAVPFEPLLMLGSINFSLLLLLLCLMAIVAGLRESGLFTFIYRHVFHGEISSRSLGRFFIFSCFFSSMIITNDVALIIFVPLAVTILTETRCARLLIPVVTWQTIAANMGSMLTPIGNPQNLFIYSNFQLDIVTFLSYTAPTVIISGIVIYIFTFLLHDKRISLKNEEQIELKKIELISLLILFTFCLMNVLRVVPTWLMAIVIIPSLLLKAPRLLMAADFKLLLLFLFLFIGVGNLTRIPEVSRWATDLLQGHEFFVSLILSQFLSNVPTTVMLSPYTAEAKALLLGVNIGGLGTIIASMASIISFKAYISTRHSSAKNYLLIFTVDNLGLLILLLILYLMLSN